MNFVMLAAGLFAATAVAVYNDAIALGFAYHFDLLILNDWR